MYCIFRCSQKMEPYERLAEFFELTLRDVDLENKVLNIECQFQKTSDRRLIVKSARTSAGTQKIPMTDDVTRCFQGIIEDREPPHRRELNKNRDNKILPHLRQQMDEMSYPLIFIKYGITNSTQLL